MENKNLFSSKNRTGIINAVAHNVSENKNAVQLVDNRKNVVQKIGSNVCTSSPVAQRKSAPIQLATLIDGTPGNYHYDNNTDSCIAGMHAWAYLDPDNPAHGSAPSDSALSGAMTDLRNLNYKSMIKGHLINGQIGGPGVEGNLFPITSQANSKHKWYAENLIKKEVTDRKGTGTGVYYSVDVTDAIRSSSSPSASFTCEAYEWDKSKGQKSTAVNTQAPILKPLDIESYPHAGSTGSGVVTPLLIGINAFGQKFKHKTNNPVSVNFPNAKLGTGWGEEGSGRGSKGRDWGHTDMDLS